MCYACVVVFFVVRYVVAVVPIRFRFLPVVPDVVVRLASVGLAEGVFSCEVCGRGCDVVKSKAIFDCEACG